MIPDVTDATGLPGRKLLKDWVLETLVLRGDEIVAPDGRVLSRLPPGAAIVPSREIRPGLHELDYKPSKRVKKIIEEATRR